MHAGKGGIGKPQQFELRLDLGFVVKGLWLGGGSRSRVRPRDYLHRQAPEPLVRERHILLDVRQDLVQGSGLPEHKHSAVTTGQFFLQHALTRASTFSAAEAAPLPLDAAQPSLPPLLGGRLLPAARRGWIAAPAPGDPTK